MEICRNLEDLDHYIQKNQLSEIDSVKNIVSKVKREGDAAVKYFTSLFDQKTMDQFEVEKIKIEEAYLKADKSTISAIKKAAKRIEIFATKQMGCFQDFSYEDDVSELGQKIVPLDSVGCYIPGGRYPLFSTVLMTVIPAKVAGVKNIIVCSPNIHPLTLIAADIAGASQIFQVGGAQAISAMAYGTESIPKVCKIVGPGNQYVSYAKKLVYGEVGIDFIAGPSEVLVIADETGNSSYIAADLLAQAEHDPLAIPILLTTSENIAQAVNKEINYQLNELKTKAVADVALLNGKIFLVDSITTAVTISNRIAPEHLELQVHDIDKIVPLLTNYGSLFIGNNSAEVFGDYCSGTNHVLPTNGAARYSGGLSVKDFLKILTYQKMKENISTDFIEIATNMAKQEGLDAHHNAAFLRQKHNQNLK
ncbi:Histidinol dehydrogenase [Candidatus Lokiarchaeum ossiferum]|uniref:Histidinol dehydrogenase n=1 Tax=Candidatus Lokiarchaeum ossiferum TaxID=2951803 RepID=A0ABY6HWT2_9ARCH|nr:Histidinol dehydrogenase [Candidatus Lokiarchaeum sp. B-35]